VRRLEAELSRALLGPDTRFEIEFDMSSLLRSDPETRWQSHKIAVETGVLDPDEIRQVEGWNPRGVASEARSALPPHELSVPVHNKDGRIEAVYRFLGRAAA